MWITICVCLILPSMGVQAIPTPSTLPTEICHVKVDLGFLLDSSGSLKSHYNDEKSFLKSVAALFDVRDGAFRAGVITFSRIAEHSIKLSDFSNLDAFNMAVDNIKLMGNWTRIDRALRLAQKRMFTKQNGGRIGIKKMLILLTDGKQTEHRGYEKPEKIAAEIRSSGVTLVVVGIGKEVSSPELSRIAGGMDKVFLVKSFNELLSKTFHEFIKDKICRFADFLDALVGVWSIKYKKRVFYTITKQGRILGSPKNPFDYKIVMSENQRIFPSSAGWMKAEDGEDCTYFYFRVQNGQIYVHDFAPSYKYEYQGLGNYRGAQGVGKKVDFLKKMMGVWSVMYGPNGPYHIVINRDRIQPAGKCCSNNWEIVMSDNQKIFPSRDGWFKAVGVQNSSGTYFYFHLTKFGVLEIQFFGPQHSGTYQTLKNYYGVVGLGQRQYHKLLGVWEVKFESKLRYTITNEGIIYGDPKSPFRIDTSDNQPIFPSSRGWFKAIGEEGGNCFYLRVTNTSTLEVIYFGPGYSKKYRNLTNYRGTPGVGNKTDFLEGLRLTKWNVKRKTIELVFTITLDGRILGHPSSPFTIVMSDNQKIFPSSSGWLKAITKKSFEVFYFRQTSQDILEFVPFAPWYFGHSYKTLPDYSGSLEYGKRIDRWVKQATSICYSGTTMHDSAIFKANQDGLVDGVKLVHISGWIKCRRGETMESYWGCVNKGADCQKDNCLGTVILDTEYNIFLPKGKFASGHNYNLNQHGNKHNSKNLIIPSDTPMKIKKNDIFEITLGPLINEIPGTGKHCVDVYFRYKIA